MDELENVNCLMFMEFSHTEKKRKTEYNIKKRNESVFEFQIRIITVFRPNMLKA